MRILWRFGLYFSVVNLVSGCAFVTGFDMYAPVTSPSTAWRAAGIESSDHGVSQSAFECSTELVIVSPVEVATHPYFAGPILPVIPDFFFPGVRRHPPKFYVRVHQADGIVQAEKIRPQIYLTDEHGNLAELACSTPSNLLRDPRGSRVMGYSFQVSLPEELPGEMFSIEFKNVVEGCELPLLKFEKESFTRFYYTGF